VYSFGAGHTGIEEALAAAECRVNKEIKIKGITKDLKDSR
jgi:hypothetical protein